MSSMDMFKAITPLDYLGSGVNIDTTTTISTSNPNPTDTNYYNWQANAGNITITHKYTANKLVLMDDLHIKENNSITSSGGSGATGTFNYTINLVNSTDQIINKYCRFRFSFIYSGAGLSSLQVNINVGTPWMGYNSKKSIIIHYGSISSGTKVSPYLYVDWSDSSVLEYYYT